MKNEFDVLIVGGSYAGLSAAMALGRSLRQVLVMDSGQPCNRFTPHAHNFITHDGKAPADIAQQARQDVARYNTVHFHEGLAVEGRKTASGFEVKTQAGELFFGKKLLFATGIKDHLPDIEGFEACWGISMIHCPYCHGYEFRGQKTGIWANGPRAFHPKTSIEGIFACGDNSTMLRSLANAVYSGNLAGVMVNMALTEDDF